MVRSQGADRNGFAPRAGFRPFHPDHAESTLAVRFREAAARHSDAIAVVEGSDRRTYAQLLARAESIAQTLQQRAGTPGTVALCLPSGLETVEAILGVLLWGGRYLCIDPSWPDPQVSAILEAARPVAVLRGGESTEVASDGSRPPHTAQPGDIVALYATSGSTGEPKLVAMPHRAILFDIGRQVNDLYLGPDDRFDLLFSFAFSAALAPIFGSLLNGGELHLLDLQRHLAILPAWLESNRITVSTMTVSVLRILCARPLAVPALRLLSTGGEPLFPADVEAFRAAFPPTCVLQNAMAATETRTYAQYFVPREGAVECPVPIGWPVHGKQVILLDEDGSSVPHGEEGEIAVRSRYLASGYCNDTSRTAEKFCDAADGTVLYRTGDRGRFRADGSLAFLGRRDSQVKIRGYRVELGAIEDAIRRHPLVVQAAVAEREQRIVAYVVMKGDAPDALGTLRRSLRGTLPEYMIPAAFVPLDGLPLTVNHKVDYRRLPPPSPTAAVIAEVWRSTLGVSPIGMQEQFFDIGGDSLSAVRVALSLGERFGVELPADVIRRYPTIESLAALIDAMLAGDAVAGTLVPFRTSGSRAPVFFVHSIGGSAQGFTGVARALGPERPAYGLSALSAAAHCPELSVESMAAGDVKQIRPLMPPGTPCVLAGHSMGSTIAFEMARQMVAAGGVEPRLVLIDMPALHAPGVPPDRWPRKLADVLLNLPRWSANEAATFDARHFSARVRGNIERGWEAFRGRAADSQLNARVYFGSAPMPAAQLDLARAMYRALKKYVPQPYPGRAVVLRARVPSLFRRRDPRMGWQHLARGGVEVHSIPGTHGTCIREEYAAGLARFFS